MIDTLHTWARVGSDFAALGRGIVEQLLHELESLYCKGHHVCCPFTSKARVQLLGQGFILAHRCQCNIAATQELQVSVGRWSRGQVVGWAGRAGDQNRGRQENSRLSVCALPGSGRAGGAALSNRIGGGQRATNVLGEARNQVRVWTAVIVDVGLGPTAIGDA